MFMRTIEALDAVKKSAKAGDIKTGLKYVIDWEEFGAQEGDEPVFIAPDGGLCKNNSDAAWEFDDAIEAAKEIQKLRKKYSAGRLSVATIYG